MHIAIDHRVRRVRLERHPTHVVVPKQTDPRDTVGRLGLEIARPRIDRLLRQHTREVGRPIRLDPHQPRIDPTTIARPITARPGNRAASPMLIPTRTLSLHLTKKAIHRRITIQHKPNRIQPMRIPQILIIRIRHPHRHIPTSKRTSRQQQQRTQHNHQQCGQQGPAVRVHKDRRVHQRHGSTSSLGAGPCRCPFGSSANSQLQESRGFASPPHNGFTFVAVQTLKTTGSGVSTARAANAQVSPQNLDGCSTSGMQMRGDVGVRGRNPSALRYGPRGPWVRVFEITEWAMASRRRVAARARPAN